MASSQPMISRPRPQRPIAGDGDRQRSKLLLLLWEPGVNYEARVEEHKTQQKLWTRNYIALCRRFIEYGNSDANFLISTPDV